MGLFFLGFIVCVAPIFFETSRRLSNKSVVITFFAPPAATKLVKLNPIGPCPKIATFLPRNDPVS